MVNYSGFLKIDDPLVDSMQNLSSKYSELEIKKKIAEIYTFTNNDYQIRVWSSPNFIDLKNRVVGVFISSNEYTRKGFYPYVEEMLRTSGYNMILVMESLSLTEIESDINLFKRSMGLSKNARYSKTLLKDWTSRINHAKTELNKGYNSFFFEMPQHRTEFNTFTNLVLKYKTLSANKIASLMKEANKKYLHQMTSQFNMK